MPLRKIISAGLVCLIAINGMSGAMGALLVCLHAQEQAAVPVVNFGGGCCHDAESPKSPECGDCTDVKLKSTYAQAIRVSDTPAPLQLADSGEILPVQVFRGDSVETKGPNPARAPPAKDLCVLITRTVVLRI
ncbi:MAG: hypothetical protein Q7Q73_07675 [Verrucomicrobiota bacterium JB024]|nr:hypothetical protein [Verrucomicrobiota bacterium JB024]